MMSVATSWNIYFERKFILYLNLHLKVEPKDKWTFHPIDIVGTKFTRVGLDLFLIEFPLNVQVEGITIANSAFHSLMMVNSYQPEDPTCKSININIL